MTEVRLPVRRLHRKRFILLSLACALFVLSIVLSLRRGADHDRGGRSAAAEKEEEEEAEDDPPPSEVARELSVHVWRHGARMARRFLRSYGARAKDALEGCPVRNCRLQEEGGAEEADALLFHLHQTKGPHTLPQRHPAGQVWIFFTDESPHHTFLATRRFAMRDYDGLFNWSMTYRSDSDVAVPYGRTVLLSEAERKELKHRNYFLEKPKGVAILGSNCGGRNHRWEYVRELQKHVEVDVFGGCGNRSCPGHFTRDCPLLREYKFYLAFENSDCREYVTEKLWWNGFHQGALPVVMGPPRSDYERLCPPGSFLHVEDFGSPLELARHLEFLSRNESAYNSHFEWKKSHKVLNEHGYFGSPSRHLCRICQRLNRHLLNPGKESQVYNDLEAFWSEKSDCYSPVWTPD